MAAFVKFGDLHAACGKLRHILRDIKKPANKDIDPSRSNLNYSLAPKRSIKPYGYLKRRLKELRTRREEDLNVLCGWVVTKPKDLPDGDERRFFQLCYDFLADRYGGEKNVVTAEVHKDESGEPHLHFSFIPVTKNVENENMLRVIRYMKRHPDANNSQAARDLGISRKTVRRWRDMTEADIRTEKVSAYEVINRAELRAFHGDLQKHLNRNGIYADVNSGVTREQGGNKTVKELKQEREIERQREIEKQEQEYTF